MKKKIVIMGISICVIAVILTVLLFSGVFKNEYRVKLPSEMEESGIVVEPIENMSSDFICGVDISSIIAEEESGVVYYNLSGEEEDLFKILADAGVNYIRVRVWNDPFDSKGRGYGGGNVDTETAAKIGVRAAEYGMQLLIDYHYSDFWADPGKQQAPKAWEKMTLEEKETALYEFTKESLKEIIEAGADVGMVQLGNETNNGMAGETKKSAIAKLMIQGSNAVKEVEALYETDIKIAIHLTNPENQDAVLSYLQTLWKFDLDYDVLGLSYYPFWHGSLDNLKELAETVIDEYDKEIMVVETSYPYTDLDGDGQGNSVGSDDLPSTSIASVQSQVDSIRDICATIASLGDYGLGLFYWEPAWIPVGNYQADPSVIGANENLWQKYGSGWASSFAAEYDAEDAGVYYGGSSWDNQAFFDFDGHALPSLEVFKYLRYGSTAPLSLEYAEKISVNINVGSEIVLPETVQAYYNNRAENGILPVTWNQDEIDQIDTNQIGEYSIHGVLEDGTVVTATILVSLVNFISNPSFEDDDLSMYRFIYDDVNPADFLKKEADAYSGQFSLHYWRMADIYFQCEQDVNDLELGTYTFSIFAQGGDSAETSEYYIYAISGDQTYTASYQITGYQVWTNPSISNIEVNEGTITVGVFVKDQTGAWGTCDDWKLTKNE